MPKKQGIKIRPIDTIGFIDKTLVTKKSSFENQITIQVPNIGNIVKYEG